MKIFLSNLNENWIVDRLKSEWEQYNSEITTNKIRSADIVWIISPWTWKKIPLKHLKNKIVVCTIHHLEDSDFSEKGLKEFYERDKYVDLYHVISENTKIQLQKISRKETVSIPFWLNQKIFFNMKNKEALRKKYNIPINKFVIGSFQRDTEGNDLKSPKLIKGPDRLIKIYEYFYEKNKDILILLSGTRRNYIIDQLNKRKINFQYFEMVDFKTLNELYNILDLYIVASRVEGGPQAILECAATKTPIISTDVGLARAILPTESIFNMSNFKNAEPKIEYPFQLASKNFFIPKGFDKFVELFKNVYEKKNIVNS